mmetsp:Transcript_15506/g.25838  ORF Transcript_15506/g.25838 Transcript_15506/m.25838 type:complete len:112 (-) Transcript_15506:2205-2540(-)
MMCSNNHTIRVAYHEPSLPEEKVGTCENHTAFPEGNAAGKSTTSCISDLDMPCKRLKQFLVIYSNWAYLPGASFREMASLVSGSLSRMSVLCMWMSFKDKLVSDSFTNCFV